MSIKLIIAITDKSWFELLRQQEYLDQVKFLVAITSELPGAQERRIIPFQIACSR